MKKSPLTTPLQKGGIITQTWEQILNLSPISNPNRWEMLAFVCLLSILLFPSFCFATPKEVTIFPQAARVTETTKVRLLPEGKDIRKAIISLPGRTDPDSFIAYPLQDKRLKIEDLIWRQGVREDDAKTKELRKRIKLLKDEKNGLEASLHSLDAQTQFWQQQIKAKAKPSEAGGVAAAIGKNIKKAHLEKLNMGSEMPRLDKKINELEQELKLSTVDNQNIWEVTMLLSGTAAGETMLTYSYTLTGCGWLPLYRLDARPQDRKINFIQEAEIWQNSGESWNDVNMELATVQAPPSFTPADISPWIIKPRMEASPDIKQETKKKTTRAHGKAKTESQIISTGPVRENEKTTSLASHDGSLILNAGRHNLPAGAHHKINIVEEIWNADFSYLSQPSHSLQAFIRAFVRFSEAREIPAGTAFFSYDGATLGKRNFALSGREGTLLFGQDPLITVTSHILSKQDGSDSGKEKKFYRQQLRLDARNSHPFPVRLHIEEARPRSLDERIKITLSHEPLPSKLTMELVIWEIELAAGEKKSINFGWEIEAPTDIEITF